MRAPQLSEINTNATVYWLLEPSRFDSWVQEHGHMRVLRGSPAPPAPDPPIPTPFSSSSPQYANNFRRSPPTFHRELLGCRPFVPSSRWRGKALHCPPSCWARPFSYISDGGQNVCRWKGRLCSCSYAKVLTRTWDVIGVFYPRSVPMCRSSLLLARNCSFFTPFCWMG